MVMKLHETSFLDMSELVESQLSFVKSRSIQIQACPTLLALTCACLNYKSLHYVCQLAI